MIFIISFSFTQNECLEFEREECESLSFCSWTNEGCTILNDEEWGDDHDWDEEDWEDECRLLETEEDCVESGCMWDAEEGCYKGDEEEWEDDEEWGDDHDWDEEFLKCEDYSQDECFELPYCEWFEDACVETEYDWCDDHDWDWEYDEDVDWDFDFSFCYELNNEACDVVPFCSWNTLDDICGINQWGWGQSSIGFSFGNGQWNWSEAGFDLGDINIDSQINIIDVVKQVNYIIEQEIPNDLERWASDLNADNTLNVVDVVNLINIIIDERIVYSEASFGIKNNSILTKGNIGAIQFDGELLSTIDIDDYVYSANGKTVIINPKGCLETTNFKISDNHDNLIVVASSGIELSVSTIENLNLLSNYPNPFNPSTTINYGLNFDSNIDIAVYSIDGKLVETLVSEYKNTGFHSLVWDAQNYANGMYLVKLNTPYESELIKITLLK